MFGSRERSKERQVRESLLDSPCGELADFTESLPSGGHKDHLIGLFEDFVGRFVGEGGMDGQGDHGDGVISVYEGGDKGGLNDSKVALLSSLKGSGHLNAVVDQEKQKKMQDDYYQSLLNKSPIRLEALDMFLLLDVEND